MRSLDLIGNPIKQLPPEISQLTSLSSFSFDDPTLSDLNHLKPLKNLEYLSFGFHGTLKVDSDEIKKMFPNCKVRFNKYEK